MTLRTRHKRSLAAACVLALTLGCQLLSTQVAPVETSRPAATYSMGGPTESAPAKPAGDAQAPPPGEIGAATPTPQPEAAPPDAGGSQPESSPGQNLAPCPEPTCLREGSFWLERPIGPEGRNTIVTARRFGEYQRATKYALRGVYFLNSSGTPVLAAADGEVVAAGDDSQTPYGPILNSYGNLVILKHRLPQLAQPLFTLYAHLSEVSVEVGETVSAGQQIGLVGMSGTATGSTLLFEVRLGENDFDQARNPELWLEPLAGQDGKPLGAVAGRILDADGKFLEVGNIVVEQLAGPGLPAVDQFYLKTYASDKLLGLDPWMESFAAGDLAPGEYQISFYSANELHQRVITIEPGQLTLVTFIIG